MIRYALQCAKGHDFEAWFSDSAAFDAQAKAKLVTCPDCGSHKVEKQLMAPRLSLNAGHYKAVEAAAADDAKDAADTQSTAPAGRRKKRTKKSAEAPVATSMGIEPKLLEALREIRREVTSKADYVGRKFAEEARKIHLEEAPARGIYGEASLAEVKELAEEGIDCAPLPILPEDFN